MKNIHPATVVMGIGNVLMKDDGVGVWAVRRLVERYRLPSSVRVIEGGVGGLRLLPFLTESRTVLIVDAVDRGGPPGTLYRMEAGEIPGRRRAGLSAHTIGLAELMSTARMMGRCPRARLIGVQPSEFQTEGMELTPSVRKALPRAVRAVVDELREMGIAVKVKTRKRDRLKN
jgi:hydrogenase maturation protease